MYKHLDKLNVKSNLPDLNIAQYNVKKFRNASDICKYDCSLEKSVLKEYEEEVGREQKTENAVKSTRKYSVKNEEILRSLSELRDDRIEEEPTSIVSRKDSLTQLRMKAQTAAELYLGLDDAASLLNFIDFYVELFQSDTSLSTISDEKIVKTFMLFEGNVQKSAEFLVTSEELEELGFEQENVTSALLLHSNDREAALDFLMKQ